MQVWTTIPVKYLYALKLGFYCFPCSAILNQNYFIQLISQHQTVARDFKSSNKNATGV